MPRHTDHLGFGLRDLHRCLSGPRYAARYRALAAAAGVDVRTATTATAWAGPRTLVVDGARRSRRARRRRRHPRLGVSRATRGRRGSSPATDRAACSRQAACSSSSHFHGATIGRRAVVVGAEHVSFSAVLTLAHAGVTTVAMVTEAAAASDYARARVAGGRPAGRADPDLHIASRRIHGRGRVDGVTSTDWSRTASTSLPATRWCSPATGFRTTSSHASAASPSTAARAARASTASSAARRPGVFAAGNLVHAAETADVAALSGRHAARAAHAFLGGRPWPEAAPLAIVVEPPIRWIAPSAVAADVRSVPHGHFLIRIDRFLDAPEIEVRQDARVLARQRYRRLAPARSIHLDAAWLDAAAADGPPIVVRIRPSRAG